MHRSDDPHIYEKKAREQAEVMRLDDREAGLVDLGCGAGELLSQLCKMVRVEAGFDISESMLEAARAAVAGSGIALVRGDDVCSFLVDAPQAIWTTTGAINQYLEPARQRKLLDLFSVHSKARAYYLFDCVDPIRYNLLAHGISYRRSHLGDAGGWVPAIKRSIRRSITAGRIAIGGWPDASYLGNPAMGWGQLPRFWMKEADARKLEIEIVSSRYYEYRYHVIVRKPGIAHG